MFIKSFFSFVFFVCFCFVFVFYFVFFGGGLFCICFVLFCFILFCFSLCSFFVVFCFVLFCFLLCFLFVCLVFLDYSFVFCCFILFCFSFFVRGDCLFFFFFFFFFGTRSYKRCSDAFNSDFSFYTCCCTWAKEPNLSFNLFVIVVVGGEDQFMPFPRELECFSHL